MNARTAYSRTTPADPVRNAAWATPEPLAPTRTARMRREPERNALMEVSGQWLLALLVIAATAVIVVSLFGLARMTGLMPRVGAGHYDTDTARDKARSMPKDREGATPDEQRPSPSTPPGARAPRRIAQCMHCGASAEVRARATLDIERFATRQVPRAVAS